MSKVVEKDQINKENGMKFDVNGNQHIETIQDPKTGETIHRVVIDQKLIDEIDGTIKKHQETMNSFVLNSQNFFKGLQIQLNLLAQLSTADEAIKKTLVNVTKKAKLDQKKPWAFNINLKCYEYRTPPTIQGIPDAEIKKGK